ncbi:hypothetical protein SAMN04488128_1011157 [Chitinophaga eiseniae]|uniref:DUF6602 domain-containing protein n=1 Tax=Chitinophaga eiseniae TaxID=634771 RepID=A0A1T4MLP6_9BACT|nr:DUF6602 domain-containing protein [Chitinophaga eiseniae]SJZ67756.1 hypothetical protein SAMN04488128_1011157 [Chitinophaga eiseniae]
MQLTFYPKPGDLFIAGDTYENARIIQAYKNEEENDKLFGWYLDSETAKPVKKPVNDYPKPFFPAFLGIRKHRDELTPFYELYRKITTLIDDLLLERNGFTALIGDIEAHLTSNEGIDAADATLILKACAGNSLFYKYKRLESGEYLTFSDLRKKVENNIIYNCSLADELKIKSNKINLLVSHNQTVGNYRELLLRDLLKKHLPLKFSIATGFIQGFSRQLDIIIYDSQNFPIAFNEGNLVVIQQEAVRAVIEVKTTLDSTTLFETLEMFHEISLPGFRSTKLPIFTGLFAFDTDYVQSSTIAKNIDDFYNKPYYNDKLKANTTRDILYLTHEISSVCVMGKYCLWTQYDRLGQEQAPGNLLPILFSVSDSRGRDIQTAAFLSHLFDYLDVDYYAKKSSILDFQRLSSASTKIVLEKKLAPDDWFPRIQIGHGDDQKSIVERYKLFCSWFTGEISTRDFILSFEQQHSFSDQRPESKNI